MNSQKIHSLNFTPISYQITSSRQDESSLQVLKTPKLEEESLLEANADTYREVIKQLSTQLQECIVENKELKNRLNLIENENEESFTIINKQNQELQNTNITLQQKINNLINEIQLSQTQMLEKETRIVKLQDLEQNSDKIAHLLEENNKLIKIIETQQEEIKTQKKLIQQFESQIQQNVEQNKERHNKIDILQREIEIFKTQNDQFKDQVNLWHSRYQSLEQNYQIQYNDLYQKFNLSQNQISELTQQLNELNRKHDEELELLNQEYQQKIIKNKQNSKIKLLEEQIEDLKEQLQFKKNQIQSLREELIDANKSNKKNEQHQFEKYEDKIRQLEEQIQEFTKEQSREPINREPINRDSNYYSRQSDKLKLQLFSEKKDYLRPQYKENIPDTRFNYSYKYYRND